MRGSIIRGVRSLFAIAAGFIIISLGTILTFNVLVGQVTIDSPPLQMILGTIGAIISGLAGGLAAGLIAPRAPILHAIGIWIPIAIDTTSIVLHGNGPVWFDLAGSSILAISALVGGIVAATFKHSPPRAGAIAAG